MNTPPLNPEKSSLGIDANLAALLAYILGFFTGIAFLVLEKENKYVRFHAMQSTLVFAFIMVINVALSVIPFFGPLVSIFLIGPATVILWLLLMYKAYNNEKFKFPILGDIAEKQVE